MYIEANYGKNDIPEAIEYLAAVRVQDSHAVQQSHNGNAQPSITAETPNPHPD
jgi:hypothetical protein